MYDTYYGIFFQGKFQKIALKKGLFMEISGTGVTLSDVSTNVGNVTTATQVKVLKGANEQLEAVVGTLLQGITDIGRNLDVVA